MITGRFEQAEWLLAEIDHRREWWAAELLAEQAVGE